MQAARRHRLPALWVALIAILMATFAPSVSAWRGGEGGGVWGVVCSAADSAAAASVDRAGDRTSGRTGGPGLMHLFEHCPYCALHADLAPPPALRVSAAFRPIVFRALPIAFLEAPRTAWAWSSARPRAPPIST